MAFAPPRRSASTTGAAATGTRASRSRPAAGLAAGAPASQLPVRSPTKLVRPASAPKPADTASNGIDKENINRAGERSTKEDGASAKKGARVIQSRYMQAAVRRPIADATLASRAGEAEARRAVIDKAKLLQRAPSMSSRSSPAAAAGSRAAATRVESRASVTRQPATARVAHSTQTDASSSTPLKSQPPRNEHASTPARPAADRDARRGAAAASASTSPRSTSSTQISHTTPSARHRSASVLPPAQTLSSRDRLLLTVRCLQHGRVASRGEANLALLESSARAKLGERWRLVRAQHQASLLDRAARRLRADADELAALSAKDLMQLDNTLARLARLHSEAETLHGTYLGWRAQIRAFFDHDHDRDTDSVRIGDRQVTTSQRGSAKLGELPQPFFAAVAELAELAASHLTALQPLSVALAAAVAEVQDRRPSSRRSAAGRRSDSMSAGRASHTGFVPASATPASGAEADRPHANGDDGGGNALGSGTGTGTGTVSRLLLELTAALRAIRDEAIALAAAARREWAKALVDLDDAYARLPPPPVRSVDGAGSKYAWDT